MQAIVAEADTVEEEEAMVEAVAAEVGTTVHKAEEAVVVGK